MLHDLQIKQLGAADAALLHAVATEAYCDHYADTWDDGGAWYLQTYFSVARLQEEMQDANARFYFIYYKGTPAGFLKLNRDKPLPGSKENAMKLERIYLAKDVTGNGVGTEVLSFVFEQARIEKLPLVWLKVMDTNPAAVRFYQKRGFDICGTHEVTFPQKKEGMRGMYIMKRQL